MNRNVTFAARELTGLTLKLAWASAEIYADRVEEMQVLVSGDEHDVSELRIRQEGTQLLVEQPNYGLSMKLHNERWMQLFIRVPRDWKGAVSADSISGELTVRGLIGTDLLLESASGSIRTTNTSFITTGVKTVSGDIELSAPVCEQMTLRTVSGSAAVSSGNTLRLHLTSVSGDCAVTLVNVPVQAEGSSVTGQTVLNVPMADADASLRSVSGRLLTENISIREGSPKMSFSSVSGNLIIRSTL